MPHGVLQHHHGVVHKQSDRQSQGHERQVVEAVAEHEHDRERHEQGKRQRNNGNRRLAHAAQKEKDDQHDERKGDEEGQLHVVDAFNDLHRAVVVDVGFNRRRKRVLQLSQRVSHRPRHEDVVGAGGGRHRDDQRRGARLHPARPEIYDEILVLKAVNGLGDVLDPHRRAVLIPDDQILVVLRRAEAGLSD